MAGSTISRVARLLLACFSLSTMMALGVVAQAQTYPTKPIRLIVPWPPGGGVDTAARIISAAPGASVWASRSSSRTSPAPRAISAPRSPRSEKPDGYTLLMGSVSPNAVNPHLYAARLRSRQGLRLHRATSTRCRASWWCRPRRRQHRAGTRRLRESQPGQAQFRVRRRRLLAASVRRHVQCGDQYRRRPRRLQGHGARPRRRWSRARSTPARSADLPAVRRRPGKLKALAVRLEGRNPAMPERAHAGRSRHPRRLHVDLLRRHGARPRRRRTSSKSLNKEINAILQTEEIKTASPRWRPSPARFAGGIQGRSCSPRWSATARSSSSPAPASRLTSR